MDRDRLAAIDQAFEAVLDAPDAERTARLAAVCGVDDDLRREVLALLAAMGETTGFVDRPGGVLAGTLGGQVATHLADAPDATAVGQRVGPYRLLEVIGEGGMGTVYRARRDDGEFEHEVALKVIRGHLADAAAGDRFRAERQILARISHPNVARLHDGGVTADGQPYFTMELVEGERIDRWCDQRALSIEHRLQMFMTVCEAVSAVHRSFVLHRDLKPSNILVAEPETDGALGQVKLLDFGIAKLRDPGAEPGGLTLMHQRPFTPDYASPEQVRGEVMTASADVYSLGVLLYRLLTGLKVHQFEASTPKALEEAICEREATRPSLAVRRLAGAAEAAERSRAAAIGEARCTGPERLPRQLEGDLDTIVLKALDKAPERRYATVEDLRADIGRSLSGHPVRARPDTLPYRLQRFLRRHRSAVAVALVVVTSLVAGLVSTSLQARRARAQERLAGEQRDAARAEALRAQRVSRLMTDIFKLADPTLAEGKTVTARELLDEGTRRIEAELKDDPVTRATLLETIGGVYRNLALLDEAEDVLERALTLRREQTPAGIDLDLIGAVEQLAWVHFDRGNSTEAAALFEEALAGHERGGSDATLRIAALRGLGNARLDLGDSKRAAPLLSSAFDLIEARPDDNLADGFDTLLALAEALHQTGRMDEVEALFWRAVEVGQAIPQASGRVRAHSLRRLASFTLQFEHDAEAAESFYRQALATAERYLPANHPDLAVCANELALTLNRLGRPAEAEAFARQALAMRIISFGDPHRLTAWSRHVLALVLQGQGKVEEAEAAFRASIADFRHLYPEGSQNVIVVLEALASLLEEADQLEPAEAVRVEGLAEARALYGDDHAYTARGLAGLATLRKAQGDTAESERLLREALATRRRLHDAGHWRIAYTEMHLGECLADQGRIDEARELLETALATLEAARGTDDGVTREARTLLQSLGPASATLP